MHGPYICIIYLLKVPINHQDSLHWGVCMQAKYCVYSTVCSLIYESGFVWSRVYGWVCVCVQSMHGERVNLMHLQSINNNRTKCKFLLTHIQFSISYFIYTYNILCRFAYIEENTNTLHPVYLCWWTMLYIYIYIVDASRVFLYIWYNLRL